MPKMAKDPDEGLVGVGLRHPHFSYLLEKPQIEVDFFEVTSENFLFTRGRPWRVLKKIREDYPIAMHGVSLSLGTVEPFDKDYLKALKVMKEEIEPFIVSDHLCWTGHAHQNLHNLLPLPYNDETLRHLVSRIQYVQDYLGSEIAVENLSAYFTLKESQYCEWEFNKLVAQESGCKLLFDINNVFVNSKNQCFDAEKYLEEIPNDLIAEIHLAGFSDRGDYLFDTHSHPVFPEVWDLFSKKAQTMDKAIPILIEWDEDIPDFSRLEKEAITARHLWIQSRCREALL